MTLQQLQYIVAVDTHRHFVKASEACFVTQPTLSIMIHRLEDELGVKVFDRNKQPVEPTVIGREIIKKARYILDQAEELKSMVGGNLNDIKGEIRLGVIPTVAPYLLPVILPVLMDKYPDVNFTISEFNTEQIIDKIISRELDMAILATPLNNRFIEEHFLYNERFVAYIAGGNVAARGQFIRPQDIDPEELWLLNEGHCLRTQALRLCEMQDKTQAARRFRYSTGSIESLRTLVRLFNGWTILPELALLGEDIEHSDHLFRFEAPSPAREISLITYSHFARRNLVRVISDEIRERVGAVLGEQREEIRIVDI